MEHDHFPLVPDGLAPAEFRRHPVTVLLRDAGLHGRPGLPSAGELDALRLSPEQRERVARACHDAAATHETGNHAAAWLQADQAASEVIKSLTDVEQRPDYLDEPEDLEGLGPSELADRIPRN